MNKNLPVRALSSELLRGVADTGRVILQAPTGSGKSTQVPQMLLEAGMAERGKILVLQPRRIAARMLAKRVAEETGSALGDLVGYQIRFEDRSSAATRIKFVTEAVLLRYLLGDPNLRDIEVVILDEFHERHLYSDVSLAVVLELQKTRRPDLKIVVMSATLDTAGLETFLAPCSVLKSESRSFPVDVSYLTKSPERAGLSLWDAAARAFADAAEGGIEGDVLIFMPGAYEIRRTIDAVKATWPGAEWQVLPLYGELPPERQDEAVAPSERRKVIVSTNVAETSLTIPGLGLVIDGGMARIASFDPNRGINVLAIEKISQASAEQRAGRAGRTGPGKCVRLWTREEHPHRRSRDLPEIRRLDLSEIFLMLKELGFEDLRKVPWMEPPGEEAVEHALRLLMDLGALSNDEKQLTPMGKRMCAFPIHPRYGRMLLAAEPLGCVGTACLIAALTQGRGILVRSKEKGVERKRLELLGQQEDSDLLREVRAWSLAHHHRYDLEMCRSLGIHALSAREVGRQFQQILTLAKQQDLKIEEGDAPLEGLLKCILAGFADQVARRQDGGSLRCRLVHGRTGEIARESVVREAVLVVATEIREMQQSDRSMKVLLQGVSRVEEQWLEETFPGHLKEVSETVFDSSIRRVVARRARCFRDLVIEEKASDAEPGEDAARILADEVEAGRLKLKHWTHEVEQWILRVNLLSKWCPELELRPIDAEGKRAILEQICFGSVSYKQIKDKQVWSELKSWLSAEHLQALESYVPERIQIGKKRSAKVAYSQENPPSIAVRIQDLYDFQEELRIAMGKVLVSVQILAPNMRPVQITQNLANFWKETYPKVKQELQRRYPKHEWR